MITRFLVARAVLSALLLGAAVALAADLLESPGTPREQLLAHFERMSEPALATAFLRCEREARVRALGPDEGALCAMAWDALLRREAAGNLERLVASAAAVGEELTVASAQLILLLLVAVLSVLGVI